MGESLARGHVLVMSLWDDHLANMLWLDAGTKFNREDLPFSLRNLKHIHRMLSTESHILFSKRT